MAPTKAQIDTLEADCKQFSATVTAWKTMRRRWISSTFNALLTKSGQKPLNVTPTALKVPASCTFVATAAPAAPAAAAGGRGGRK